MFSRGQGRSPRILIALIAGITIVPLATLAWLGWRLLEQDRSLERQQIQQRVERAADLAVDALRRALAASEQRVATGAGHSEPGAVVVSFRDHRVDVAP